jgi:hypothetical protein
VPDLPSAGIADSIGSISELPSAGIADSIGSISELIVGV